MNIDEKSVKQIKAVALDMIQTARSGHPGIVFSSAEILYTLYTRHLKAIALDSHWRDRDRFVMSAGHGSALLYSILHCMGYDISLEQLQKFRTLGSDTPGHPEITTDGVDCATGPLGQGLANAVGMAIAESFLAEKFNRDVALCDHYTYCLVGDGCLMEGVALEAISLAGLYRLNKLIVLYDKNDVTLDGTLAQTNTEDVVAKFKACHFDVIETDGHDIDAIDRAIARAKQTDQPSVVICHTIIGRESVLQNSHTVHGKPLGWEEISRLKNLWGIADEKFNFDSDVKKHFAHLQKEKTKIYNKNIKNIEKYSKKYPDLYEKYENFYKKCEISDIHIDNADLATRESSFEILSAISAKYENILVASADVASSTKAYIKDNALYSADNRLGQNLYMGVREHGMGAICNGIALHGGLRVACSCYLTFSDYMRASIRMSAMMNLPVVYLFTHDSLCAGQDGPTHQPIEQVDSLRLIPNLTVFRPCDCLETLAGWSVALERDNPTALILSRQTLSAQNSLVGGARCGAYVISTESDDSVATVIASGSEVDLLAQAQKELAHQGIYVDVVSMPCVELFEEQTAEYQQKVLKNNIIIGVEASTAMGLLKYVDSYDHLYRVSGFGRSGDGNDVMSEYGFNVKNIVKFIKNSIKNK